MGSGETQAHTFRSVWDGWMTCDFTSFLPCLDEVQEELLYYPGVGVSKMLKSYVKVFYVMGKALSGELSCPCDRSC